MKRTMMNLTVAIICLIMGVTYATAESATNLIPVSAEAAFDAVQTQTDPVTGEDKNVVLVDVRSRAEFFWVGAASQVHAIVLKNGSSICPDLGKVTLSSNGWFLKFKKNGHNKMVLARKVSELSLSPIAINIPYKLWNEATGTLSLNPDFKIEIEKLVDNGAQVVILFCRSGGRSEDCTVDFDTTLFDGVYEIDQPDGKSGRGGFEGTSYSNVYNGYRGFPARCTGNQEHESVSWKDAGLPIKTSVNPLLLQE